MSFERPLTLFKTLNACVQDVMTYLNRFLVNKTNSCTEIQFYWYYYSIYSILHLVANGHNYTKCTKADVRLRTPDDGQKGCPKHVE